MSMAYIELAGSVLFNVASYVIYKSIDDMAPRIWWPLFVFGLVLGAANKRCCCARHQHRQCRSGPHGLLQSQQERLLYLLVEAEVHNRRRAQVDP
jgi:hypothetical protein